MSGSAETELRQVQGLERGNASTQNDTIEHPEPIYQRSSQTNAVLGSTAFQDVDLERGEGLGPSTINKAKKDSKKKKRYVFGVPDNPFDDSESDNEWMRRTGKTHLSPALELESKRFTDENEPKPENNNSDQGSEQRQSTCCQSISRLAHKIPFVAYVWFALVIFLLLLGGAMTLLVLLPQGKK
ncbi:hypothetical protein ABOM_000204 [Aspergillus bombycis]|uniref:Uncharacterized protein n=1 Tax=Aspergillus bombycis TaxID=109264 RepID=A0A1F8AIC7_9EURO|nr:hypothetical protein ABOM_000204 [Aspergillus bombycis]OGM51199.1 hypothetical protein ABOM_000204 [Aspergillus bombycis]